jgi:RNA polymerase sigma factor (sigma-70 family)
MTIHQDQQYITALVNNDTTLLNELYAKYADKIKQMVLKNNGTETDAADVFQEALLAIYQKAKNNNFTLTCPIGAYLYLICKTRWINELNKKGNNKVTFMEDDGYNYTEDIFNNVAIVQNEYERSNLLQQKLKQLGEGCRELLELSWSGLAMDEVAKKMQNSYGYVRKKKSECMAKLIALVKTSPQFVTLQW